MLVRSPLLTSHKWRVLVPSGRLVCTCHVVFLWCYDRFVSFSPLYFHWSRGPLFNRSSFFVMQAPRQQQNTCFFFLFSFVSLDMSLFPSIFCTIDCRFLFVWVVRFLLPDGVFLPCDHGLSFFYISLWENSTNQIKSMLYRPY